MKKYNSISTLLFSWISSNLYRDVAKNWKGLGFSYLFFLTFVTLLIIFYQPIKVVSQMDVAALKGESDVRYEGAMEELQRHLYDFVYQIPEITVSEGQLSSTVSQPYVIMGEVDGEETPIIVLDTTGQFNTVWEAGTPVLITKDYINIFNPRKNEERTIYFNEFPGEFTFDNQVVWGLIEIFIEKYIWAFVAFMFFVILIFTYIFNIIAVLFYSLIGLLLKLFVGNKLDYAGIVRLCSVSVTPSFLLASSLVAIGTNYSSWHTIALALLYLFFALLSTRAISREEE